MSSVIGDFLTEGALYADDFGDNLNNDDTKNTGNQSIHFADAKFVGIGGTIHVCLLTTIILWRFTVFVRSTSVYDRWSLLFNKRVLFHSLLFLTAVVDLPMYLTFIFYQTYVLPTYLWHKTSNMWIFLTYSVVVSDWLDVLFDIKEDSKSMYGRKRIVLIVSNFMVVTITLVNIGVACTYSNVEDYAHSAIYTLALYFQLFSSIFLTAAMLHSGLKLAYRLRGATGRASTASGPARNGSEITSGNKEGEVSEIGEKTAGFAVSNKTRGDLEQGGGLLNTSASTVLDANSFESNARVPEILTIAHPSKGGNGGMCESVAGQIVKNSSFGGTNRGSADPTNGMYNNVEVKADVPGQSRQISLRVGRESEFLAALRRLNVVMLTCVLCNILGISTLMANTIVGYSSSASDYVVNVYFYYACYALIPLWGPTLALLYWVRPRTKGKRSRRRLKSKGNIKVKSLLDDTGNNRNTNTSEQGPSRSRSRNPSRSTSKGGRRDHSSAPRHRNGQLSPEEKKIMEEEERLKQPQSQPQGIVEILVGSVAGLWQSIETSLSSPAHMSEDKKSDNQHQNQSHAHGNDLRTQLLPPTEEDGIEGSSDMDSRDDDEYYSETDESEYSDDNTFYSDDNSYYDYPQYPAENGFRADSNSSVSSASSITNSSITSSILSDYGMPGQDSAYRNRPGVPYPKSGAHRDGKGGASNKGQRRRRRGQRSSEGRPSQLCCMLEECSAQMKKEKERGVGIGFSKEEKDSQDRESQEQQAVVGERDDEEAPLVFLSTSPSQNSGKYRINHAADYTY